MDKSQLLQVLPSYRGERVVLVDNQNVHDIIAGIQYAHGVFKADYDKIASMFIGQTVYDTCRNLWNFCKQNIPYKAESQEAQSVRSPAAILAMIDGGDCKNYSQFIGGVLDALNRQGANINWVYRFASYDIFDSTPEHVFIVVKDQGKEIWIDPVLPTFNARRPAYLYKVDKKVNQNAMPLYMIKGAPTGRISSAVGLAPVKGFVSVNTAKRNYPVSLAGIGDSCNCIAPPSIGRPRRRRRMIGDPLQATTAQKSTTGQEKIQTAGTALVTVGIALEAVPVIGTVGGAVVAAVGGLVSLAGKLFGSKWHDNNEVRWLIMFYQYYVLGQGSVTSDNKVTEGYLQDAYNWFYAVLGIPLYDRNSLALICGRQAATSKMTVPALSYPERAARYLAYPQIAQLAKDVTLEQAIAGAELADQLQFYKDAAQTISVGPGAWKNLPVAPSLLPPTAPQSNSYNTTSLIGPSDVAPTSTVQTNSAGPVSTTLPVTNPFGGTNGLLLVGVLGVGAYFIFKGSGNSRKK